MTILSVTKPNNQQWSGDCYKYFIEKAGLETINTVTSFEAEVALNSGQLALRLLPNGLITCNGSIILTGAKAINDVLFTLPFTLHETTGWSAFHVDVSENLVAPVTLFAQKSGAVKTATTLVGTEIIKLDGVLLIPSSE